MSINEHSLDSKPFIIEHRRIALTRPNQFTPSAQLIVSPTLRTSGLLATLPDTEAKTLLLLLTFLTPNGHIRPSLPELAQALKASTDKTRKRVKRLEEITFDGTPLVQSRRTESGLETFALNSAFVEEREEAKPESNSPSVPSYSAAGREAVIAHSRSQYANTRAVAERAVAAQYGQDTAETGEVEEAQARRALLALGVSREQIAGLFALYSLESIQQQLDWLPHRGAKSPGRFVVAAIQGNYEPPAKVRLERAIAEEEVTLQSPIEDIASDVFDTVSLDVPPATGER